MSLGNRLKNLRVSNGLTQMEVAQKINLSKANVSKYEADSIEPNISTLNMLSSLFNVTTDYLLGRSDIPSVEATEPQFTQDEEKLITNYRSLDNDGKSKAFEYLSDLAKLNNLNIQKIDGGLAVTTSEHEVHSSVIEEARKL